MILVKYHLVLCFWKFDLQIEKAIGFKIVLHLEFGDISHLEKYCIKHMCIFQSVSQFFYSFFRSAHILIHFLNPEFHWSISFEKIEY